MTTATETWTKGYYDDWNLLQAESKDEQWAEWQKQLLDAFLRFQDEKRTRRGGAIDEDVPEEVRRVQLRRIVQGIKTIPGSVHTELVEQLLDDQYRMGPAQPLWEKPWVSDIQIFVPHDSRYPQIITYVEKGERKVYSGQGFRDYDHARDWVNHHLSRIGLRYDPAQVQLDGMFPNGERIHVISGPVGYSVFTKGTYTFVRCMIISIRRFVASFTLDELTDQADATEQPPEPPAKALKQRKWNRRTRYTRHTSGMADKATMDFLRIMVHMGKNHVISGGTGVGKTTLANALTEAIPEDVVLLVLDEAPEMQPQRDKNVIRIYERKSTTSDGRGFTISDGLKGALRMFPDRIFVAELRDALAFVFLQAIQSGHDGSSTTVHASSCRAAIERIVNMAAQDPSAPDREMIREILFDRIDTILHGCRQETRRFFDEVVQLKPDGTIHTVMEYVQQGVDEAGEPVGHFAFYGPTDEFVAEMQRKGYDIPESWGWVEVDES